MGVPRGLSAKPLDPGAAYLLMTIYLLRAFAGDYNVSAKCLP